MPIDASIPLGTKVPDSTQQLSGLLNMANSAQTLQQNQQKTQQGGIDLNERQAVSRVLADPGSYTSADGTVDFNKALPIIMRVAPTTGLQYVQKIADAQRAHTEAQTSLNSLTTDNRARIGGVLAAIPPGTAPDVVEKTMDTLGEQYKGMGPLVSTFKQTYQHARQTGGQGAADDFIARAARQVLPQETQQAMNTPTVATLDNGQQTGLVNLKPGVQGIPQGGMVQGTQVQKLLPPGQQQSVGSDAFGNPYVVNRDPRGNITGTGPVPGAANSPNPTGGPMAFPPGESKDTFDALNQQRAAAQEAARNAGQMHDLNRTVAAEASKGFNTGSLGALTQKIASATGYKMGNESATDYNVLGKMLERSALTAAQSMGPHTNAGLEAAVRANGSVEYTPQALKKIAYLNDALVTGSELYSQGLENAIRSSPNTVFAKRDFDREWGKAATPQALRLKNAVDTGNREEIDAITKEVGGKGTKGASELHSQLRKLLDLTGH